MISGDVWEKKYCGHRYPEMRAQRERILMAEQKFSRLA
jgi:hypothetical protein